MWKFVDTVFITPGVIKAVADACIEGAVVLDLCEMGDQMILEETKKVYKKEKEMKKGNHRYQYACTHILKVWPIY